MNELKLKNIENINYHNLKVCYRESLISLEVIFEEIESLTPINLGKIYDIANLIYENIDNTNCILNYIHHIDTYTDYILCHSINVSFYAMLIGKWMCLPKSEVMDLIVAGFFHDVGKLEIPTDILNKKGGLTTEEFEIMKSHTTLGYNMLKNVLGLKEDIKKSILMHHERIDGSGYPSGITGHLIGEYAKIIAIADIYDAMTTNRVYKKRINPFETFQFFLGTGMKILEPAIVNIFISNMTSHFSGMEVTLNNGQASKDIDGLSTETFN